MDSLTQITLGAAMGELALGKKIGNRAMFLGALGGTIPDLDIVFFPLLNDVERLGFHRGYSHSLVFTVLAALLLAYIFNRLYKNYKVKTNYKDWAGLWLLSLVTHPLLDSCTTYGTQLFLPFSDYRAGLNNIFVADLFYTIPFLVLLIIAMFYKRSSKTRRRFVVAAIAVSSLYMGFTFISKTIANHNIEKALAEQNIEYTKYMSTPTPLNCILWYCVVEDQNQDGYYLGYYSLFDKTNDIQFEYVEQKADLLGELADTYAVNRLKWFSKDYYIVRQVADELHFYDIKFGRIGFGEVDDRSFIFSFKVIPQNLEALPPTATIKEVNHMQEMELEMGEAFSMLWQRLKGI